MGCLASLKNSSLSFDPSARSTISSMAESRVNAFRRLGCGFSCGTSAVRVREKKAYPAYFGSYEKFPAVREWLDSIENLYCIGRNGQHRYNNMDHSMLSAMRAVELIVSGAKDKSPLWNVNTEAEYHEEKQPAR